MTQKAGCLNYFSFMNRSDLGLNCIYYRGPRSKNHTWFMSAFISVLAHIIVLASISGFLGFSTIQPQSVRVFLQPRLLAKSSPKVVDTPVVSPDLDIQTKNTDLPKQIVSSSVSKEKVRDQLTRFLSDKDTYVDKEQVRRGDASYVEKSPQQKKHTQKPSVAASYVKSTHSERALITTGSAPAKTALFLPGSDIAFALKNGSQDYLPDIPDGEITLLNAKASKYALFVRRVAEKVFGELRASHWRILSIMDAKRANNVTTITATLSPSGKLVDVKIQESSGSAQFDQTVYQSVRNGAWDLNPPSGALGSDGNIHFVFQSQVKSSFAPTSSGEARWLMLGTGLL